MKKKTFCIELFNEARKVKKLTALAFEEEWRNIDLVGPSSFAPSSAVCSFLIALAMNLTYATRVPGVASESFGLYSVPKCME